MRNQIFVFQSFEFFKHYVIEELHILKEVMFMVVPEWVIKYTLLSLIEFVIRNYK